MPNTSANHAGAYRALLDSASDGEARVREALAILERDFRTMCLLALCDWEKVGFVVPELVTAVANLQRPSWGTWNGLLQALRTGRRTLLRSGSASAKASLEKADLLGVLLGTLETPISSALLERLKPLGELTRARTRRLTLGEALALPIALRNRIAHDSPTESSFWRSAWSALEPLVSAQGEHALLDQLPTERPTPWFRELDGAVAAFNGFDRDFAVLYVVPGRAAVADTSSTREALLAFQRLLGKSDSQEEDLRRLLTKLAPEEVKGVVLGDFLVGRVVGRGGFGTVHVGRQLSTGRRVAIKVLNDGVPDDAALRFQQEAAYLARFDNRHIVAVLGYGQDTWSAPRQFSLQEEDWFQSFSRSAPVKTYIALEWVDGETLEQVFQRDKQEHAGVRTLTDWFMQAASALDAVHGIGLLHRDVKPGNLMVTRDGIVKLMDFGIARPQDENRTIVTTVGTALGTPAYMAPEQILAKDAEAEVGVAADVYGLCASFYELYAGHRLFGHDQDSAESVKTRKIQGETPRRPRQLNAQLDWELETILLGGLEHAATDRYASMAALIRDLTHFLQNEPIEYERPSTWRRLQLSYRRNSRLYHLAAAFSVLALAGLVVYVRSIRAEQRRTLAEARLKDQQRQEAQHNLAAAKIEAAQREMSSRRFLGAVAEAKQALRIEDGLATRMSVWEALAELPDLRITAQELGQTLVRLDDGRLASATKHHITVVGQDNAHVEWEHRGGDVFQLAAPRGSGRLFAASARWLMAFDVATGKPVLDWSHASQCPSSAVNTAASLAVLGCSDAKILVYQVDATGRRDAPVVTLAVGESGTPNAIEFSPSSERLYWMDQNRLHAYDLRRRAVVWSRDTDGNGEFALSPDGNKLAWVTQDGTLRVGRAATGETQQSMPAGTVGRLSFSPAGERVAALRLANPRYGVTEWDVNTGRETFVYEAPLPVCGIAYLDMSSVALASPSKCSTGALYRLTRSALKSSGMRGAPVRWILPGEAAGQGVAFRCGLAGFDAQSTAGEAASMLDNGLGNRCLGPTATVESLPAGTSWPLPVSGEKVRSATMLGQRLLVGTADGDVSSVGLGKNSGPERLLHLDGAVTVLQAHASNRVIVGAGQSGGVYRLQSGRLELVRAVDPGLWITNARFSPDGRMAVLTRGNPFARGDDSSEVAVIDAVEGSVNEFELPGGGLVRGIEPLEAGSRWAFALQGGYIMIVERKTWKVSQVVTASMDPIRSLTMLTAPLRGYGELLVAGDGKGRLIFVDPRSGEVVHRTSALGEPITALALGPLGTDWWLGVGKHIEHWRSVGDVARLAGRLGSLRLEEPAELVQRAEAMRALGKKREAVEAYSRVLELVPDHIPSLTARSELYEELGQLDEALADETSKFKQVSSFPAPLRKVLLTGRALLLHARWEKSGQHSDLRSAIEEIPSWRTSHSA